MNDTRCLIQALCSGVVAPSRTFLFRLRKFVAVSRAELAAHVGVSASTLAEWEHGKRALSAENTQSVAEFLGARLKALRSDPTWLNEAEQNELIEILAGFESFFEENDEAN